ncbi:uncharacterized protein LOC134532271 [Bacillus rossius redtenbacheri]|uniref:uncharacterized protein LOC134532271 n=1 Tax=Bacillus rossius redtenbacheri TaxID=93214 RepID=UPI002FDD7CF6
MSTGADTAAGEGLAGRRPSLSAAAAVRLQSQSRSASQLVRAKALKVISRHAVNVKMETMSCTPPEWFSASREVHDVTAADVEPSDSESRRADCHFASLFVSISSSGLRQTTVLRRVDGSTHRGLVKQSAGGVGRNMADALGKMNVSPRPLLVTALGADAMNAVVLRSLRHLDQEGVAVLEDERTASYALVLNSKGECLFGVGDMDIHRRLDQQVKNFEQQLTHSPLVVMDGNLPEKTIHHVLSVCRGASVPVWFEPTDIRKASLPFSSDLWKGLHFVSPNINELRIMCQAAGIAVGESRSCNRDYLLEEACALSVALAKHIAVVIVTLGKLGLVVARRGDARDVLMQEGGRMRGRGDDALAPVSARVYSVPEARDVVSVSGAGDCLAAGFIAGVLSRLSEEQCVAVGVCAARLSLRSASAVPARLFDVRKWAGHAASVPYYTHTS